MAGTDSTGKFISEITQQQIFHTFLESLSVDSKSKLLSQNKLVCRNNLDLFFANENLVRCCTINPEYTNFRLLDNKYDDFKIRSLEMNSSGSLMAIIGDTELVVVSLPTSLTASNSSLLQVKSYRIHGIEGQIKKVIWQSIVANDCCLVVLNDKSEIKSYDLSLSSYEPQLSIDLGKDDAFKGEVARSISFGSSANLSGSLTLYVATSSSNIFAIYPFIHKLGKIATTESNVRDLLDESTSLITAVQERFPSKDLVQSSHQSVLNHASMKQYAYISSLYKQFETSFAPRREYRQLLSTNPLELSVLSQELPENFLPIVQGPVTITKDKTLKDLTCIGSNDNISILVSISISAGNETFLSYHSQLKPLIMKWSDVNDQTLKKEEVTPNNNRQSQVNEKEKNHEKGYIRPKRGFGYIDEVELSNEEEEKIPHINSNEFESKNREIEILFWKDEFTELSTLAIDQIPVSASQDIALSTLNSEGSKISIKIGNSIIYFDCGKWCEELVLDVSNGHIPQNLDVSSKYTLVVDGVQEISSFALIKDTMNETGDFLIILKTQKDNNLEVKQISENTTPNPDPEIIEIDTIIEKVNHESILIKEPFDELLSELDILKRVNPETLGKSLYMNKELAGVPIYGTNTEILKNLNHLSTETIQQISKFTSFAIHLNLRVTTQIDELKFQINNLQRIQKLGLDDGILDSKNEKANDLIARQNKINDRIQKLQDKIFDANQKLRYSKSLPLSDAEKLWFKEINSVNAQVSQDTDNAKCLNSVVENMTSQVSKIVNSIKEGEKQTEETQKFENKLKNLQEHHNILKLKQWLQEENDLIVLVKEKLDESFEQLKI
ncbi:DEHA2A04928p [Debaryomyces hansenii CBS767]|uniref:DEHA2A04928p n=1 Tax=Debaryomyces hansenii (strain ATCC 36239 / CBS 767 / BCRC 21394 / JCM 1990 / NBRC 0083 / IGC 2968) TaxID=284592 RepID=Q6BZ34_DEBHA|nr:DEHA2A04928p [Debaryomyces hansenii CBS767]CAG84490.2 DEHA2A04928p [Debaryomyces hansenii CBS767]|eukprot:XP_456535.2 DEHA2A04928p [Debaryomyces hansenii CBS767]